MDEDLGKLLAWAAGGPAPAVVHGGRVRSDDNPDRICVVNAHIGECYVRRLRLSDRMAVLASLAPAVGTEGWWRAGQSVVLAATMSHAVLQADCDVFLQFVRHAIMRLAALNRTNDGFDAPVGWVEEAFRAVQIDLHVDRRYARKVSSAHGRFDDELELNTALWRRCHRDPEFLANCTWRCDGSLAYFSRELRRRPASRRALLVALARRLTEKRSGGTVLWDSDSGMAALGVVDGVFVRGADPWSKVFDERAAGAVTPEFIAEAVRVFKFPAVIKTYLTYSNWYPGLLDKLKATGDSTTLVHPRIDDQWPWDELPEMLRLNVRPESLQHLLMARRHGEPIDAVLPHADIIRRIYPVDDTVHTFAHRVADVRALRLGYRVQLEYSHVLEWYCHARFYGNSNPDYAPAAKQLLLACLASGSRFRLADIAQIADAVDRRADSAGYAAAREDFLALLREAPAGSIGEAWSGGLCHAVLFELFKNVNRVQTVAFQSEGARL